MKHLILSTLLTLSAPAAFACEVFTVGDLSVEHAWSRATIGADRPGVFYVEITNAGTADDALIGIVTPAAGMPMLHETVVTDGIASMPHAMSIPVPAGQTVQLAPGGYHGMLMGLTTALNEGDSFPVTLTFEKAGEVTVTVEVLSLRAEGPDCEHAGQWIAGLGGTAGALAFTLGLGWWKSRTRVQPGDGLLPLPLADMSFSLTDHRGTQVQPADWIGRPTMVFFGFTWCPDVCPTTLSDISDWLADLGSEADRLNVALISVDPERDTPAVLADYLSNFDPRIVGLTGPLPEVEKATAGFRAKFDKLLRDGDYTMNHTAGVFLFHADGRFASIIDFHEDRRLALPKIRRILT